MRKVVRSIPRIMVHAQSVKPCTRTLSTINCVGAGATGRGGTGRNTTKVGSALAQNEPFKRVPGPPEFFACAAALKIGAWLKHQNDPV